MGANPTDVQRAILCEKAKANNRAIHGALVAIVNLLTNRDTPLLNIKETGRYGRHGREQEERDKGSKKV